MGWMKRTDTKDRPPAEIVVAVSLSSFVGVLVLLELLMALPGTLSVMGGELEEEYTFLVLAFLTLRVTIGASALYLAMLVYRGNPLAQILTAALMAAILLSEAMADQRSVIDNLVVLASAGVLVVIVFTPTAQSFFKDRNEAEPATVGAGRTLMTSLGWTFGVIGIAYLAWGGINEKFLAEGSTMASVALVGVGFVGRLRNGESGARYIMTASMVALIVLAAMLGRGTSDLTIPMVLGAAAIGLLWLPRKSRAYFRS